MQKYMQLGLLILVEVNIVIQCHNYLEAYRMYIDKNYIIAWSSTFVATTVMKRERLKPNSVMVNFRFHFLRHNLK